MPIDHTPGTARWFSILARGNPRPRIIVATSPGHALDLWAMAVSDQLDGFAGLMSCAKGKGPTIDRAAYRSGDADFLVEDVSHFAPLDELAARHEDLAAMGGEGAAWHQLTAQELRRMSLNARVPTQSRSPS